MYHVGNLGQNRRKLLHVGNEATRNWLIRKLGGNVYNVTADVSKPVEMTDSGRAHNLPSIIAEDLGWSAVANYLRVNGENELDLIRCIVRKGYNCIRYINKNESPGAISYIVWEWQAELFHN